MTTSHIQTLHFTEHTSHDAAARICRRVLMRLGELRVIEHLDRRIGGIRAGSASFVWRVGLSGDRLLRQAAGDGVRNRRKEPSVHHLDHCLAIVDVYVLLAEMARQGVIELSSHQSEPHSWRPYLGVGGQREIVKPDLTAVTATGDFEDHWFFEIDRGTESLPTVARKCQQYERYRRSGQEQRHSGVFPLVVWVVRDEVRQAKVLTLIRATRHLDPDLFRVTTLAELGGVIAGRTV
ncbi:MAG: replication-relaxation family protein [Frankiaceae bacterium]|nr:replication-relaxation family protein [Frankiaceae bacterium]MBV9869343.1 replication-relaxation family protein [Frankiaceae bacterium]